MSQEERLSNEFMFECDGHGHKHGTDDEHQGTLVMPTEYVGRNLVENIGVVTGLLHFSEDAMREANMDTRTGHMVTIHTVSADDTTKVMFLDRVQGIELAALLLEWITRIDEEDDDVG